MADLTCEHAAQVHAKLAPALGYLTRLRRRMEQLQMDDQTYHNVVRAQQSLQDLCADLHYRSCETGVDRNPR